MIGFNRQRVWNLRNYTVRSLLSCYRFKHRCTIHLFRNPASISSRSETAVCLFFTKKKKKKASQRQLWRTQYDRDPVKYSDVFDVSRDAATMQSAEKEVLGQTQKGGPASVMQSAANVNVRADLVDPDDASDAVRYLTFHLLPSNILYILFSGSCVFGGQVVGQYVDPRLPAASPGSALGITIGEALQATAYSATGDKPVDQSDAAAIKAVEVRAPRSNETPSTGIGAQAQSAADLNTRLMNDESKTTLSDVLAVYVDPRVPAAYPGSALGITIGEALEAIAILATETSSDQSDAAAIKAVEVRAPRSNETPSTGIGAQAQSAADLNTRLMNDESKTTFSDVLAVYVDPRVPAAYPGSALGITIGEALEATAYSATGDKPVDQSDAAAIKAVEVRAPRSNETPSTGIGAQRNRPILIPGL
ncbi:late embryogenesis abundant protein 31-like [Hevea brasiliensis]|uniref:late embryogenesis abundant protein 31-like n=1 Tax=Hevea brasiliensis TaxID=3981 RepID=UPI0025E76693|nr:late embryogenesis abundant protein 31-like [Hevea brasiliensis]